MLLIVAEDRPAFREILTVFLTAEGFSVHVAEHGGQVIDLLEAGAHPSLLILDLHMPVCDGADVIQYVRSHQTHADLPIILVTADGPASAPLAAQVQAVLLKPFGLGELMAQVHAFVA